MNLKNASTTITVAVLLFPALALAQSSTWNNRPSATPACVYKPVMNDAEIEACTGRTVHYDYRIR